MKLPALLDPITQLAGLSRNLCLFAAISTISFGCGGGGGGSTPFVGAALVNIDAVPRETDPGKRVQVTSRINEVHRDGIYLKIRYPDGFSFAPGTGNLTSQGSQRTVSPQFNQTDMNEGTSYLVFNLSREIFSEDNEGTLVFELRAEPEVRTGKIEIDADVNDPTVPDEGEFSIDNPEFTAQDQITIAVKR